jgi:hypothetical protein
MLAMHRVSIEYFGNKLLILTSFPDILAQTTVLTKSECPLYLPLKFLPARCPCHTSLSQHPANNVLPPLPPIATDVRGAAGPLYTLTVSLVYSLLKKSSALQEGDIAEKGKVAHPLQY